MQGDALKFKTTNTYLEFENKLEDLYLIYYIIPRSANSIFVATCWERLFDDLFADEESLKVAVQTWNLLAQLLTNGLEERYSEGAMLRLEDYDTGETKWFLVSISGNIDFESVEGFFTPRTQEVTNLVMEKSLELLVELQEKTPSASGELKSVFWGLVKNVAVNAVGILPAGGAISEGGLFETETSFDKPETFRHFEEIARK